MDDTILFNGDYPGPILRVSAAGGTPQPVTELDSKKDDRNHYWPELLPGGKAVLFSTIRAGADTFDDGRIEVQSLTTRGRHVLVEGGSYARYSPTGHLLYARSGTLLAVPFDVERLAVTGLPVKEAGFAHCLRNEPPSSASEHEAIDVIVVVFGDPEAVRRASAGEKVDLKGPATVTDGNRLSGILASPR